MLVEGERLRPNLTCLLELADYVTMSAKFPQVPPVTPDPPLARLQLGLGRAAEALLTQCSFGSRTPDIDKEDVGTHSLECPGRSGLEPHGWGTR